ncbi:MAG: NAD(P)H-quinone oxidoreductase [Vulcanimicrobiaceae bacterium]
MRAVVYEGTGGVEVIALREVPEPVLGSDDALVEVAYAGLNRADVLERQGRYGGGGRASQVRAGLEFSGVVRALGGGRTGSLTVGDRVCGLVAAGAHAELVAAHALTLSPVPDEVDLATAAAIPETFLTAHDALFTRGAFALGRTVLINAVGSGVGLAAVALAKRAGGFTLGTSRSPEKLARAKETVGLDVGILFDETWPVAVDAATAGNGVDLVLDFIGGPSLARNVDVLAGGGRIVQIGTLGGAQAALPLGPFMAKRATLIGTVLRTRPLDEKIALARAFTSHLLPLFARGELHAQIDEIYPLAEIAAAHRRMETDANFGKILLAVHG